MISTLRNVSISCLFVVWGCVDADPLGPRITGVPIVDEGPVLSGLAAGKVRAPIWEVEDLTLSLGLGAIPNAINNRGMIAGERFLLNGERSGVLWDGRRLVEAGGRVLWLDMNEAGVAVGEGEGSLGSAAFRWSPEGGTVELPTLMWNSGARAVNELGTASGWSHSDSPDSGAALWPISGGVQGLGAFGGHQAIGVDINDRGDVLVQANRELLLLRQGPGDTLEVPIPGLYGDGTGLNNLGQVVGSYVDSDTGERLAFVWSEESGLEVLPLNLATFVSDTGIVAGYMLEGGTLHGVLWSKTEGIARLPTPAGVDAPGIPTFILGDTLLVGRAFLPTQGFMPLLWRRVSSETTDKSKKSNKSGKSKKSDKSGKSKRGREKGN
jgi:uncharacterized membrane protein